MAEKPRYRRSSSGRCQFTFTPRPEKTFNRGATDYFVSGRQADIGAFDSPAFMGESVGQVSRLDRQWFEIETQETLHNGDGLSWFDSHGERQGIRINKVEAQGGAQRLHVALPAGQWLALAAADLAVGTELFRNRDQEFERLLETYLAFAPRGFVSFAKAIPLWLNEKLFQKKLLQEELTELGFAKDQLSRILFSSHHLPSFSMITTFRDSGIVSH